MKKTLNILALLLIATSCFSQSWQFAKSFGGQHGSDIYTPAGNNNRPFHLILDSEGNSYLYGTYGNLMQLADSTLPYFIDDTRGTFIAKFNCNGEVDWLKAIAHSEQNHDHADYMIMKDDFLYLTGTVRIDNFYKTWFLDTLVIGSILYNNYNDCEFPWLPFHRYTYLIKMDLAGNIVDYNIFYLRTITTHMTSNSNLWNNPANQRPFIIDNEGNFYFFTRIRADQAILFHNNNTVSDTITPLVKQAPYYIIKFDSDFNFLWYKSIVQDVSNHDIFGIGMEFLDAQVDINNNIYVTGYIQTNDTASVPQYPIYTDFGNNNLIETYKNHYSVGFILKLDNNGESVWVRQTKQLVTNDYGSNSMFESVLLDENTGSLFITGVATPVIELIPGIGTIFGTNDTIFNNEIDFASSLTGFIAKYDTEGNYYWVRIPNAEAGFLSSADLYENNLYCSVRWNTKFWHGSEVYETDVGTEGFALCSWDTNGNPTWSLNIPSTCYPGNYNLLGYDTRVNSFGEIITTGTYDYGLTFGDHYIYGEGFKMFIAKYGNPCPIIVNETATFCYGDEYNGSVLTESGEYQFILESSNPDVDSVVNLHATVYPQLTTGINDTVFCKDQTYVLEANSGYNTYEWSTGSVTSSEEFTFTNIGTENVYVTLTDNNCTGVDTIVITIDICNLLEQEIASVLSLYPVPSNSYITVQLSDNQKIESYSIYNLQGKLIKFDKINSANSFTITTHDLTTGQYLIYVKTEEGVYTGGFVKE
jgi:hypothetical protein